MQKLRITIVCLAWFMASEAAGQLVDGEIDSHGGVINGSDFSWRYYHEQLKRFPQRLGIICYNAYLLDKAGLHKEGEAFLLNCAQRGSTSAMIYLALLYEQGFVGEPDLQKATYWIKKAAKLGNPIAQYHYGLALLTGDGIAINRKQGIFWLQKAAAQGEIEAITYLTHSNARPAALTR